MATFIPLLGSMYYYKYLSPNFQILIWNETKILQETVSKEVDEDHTPRVSYNSYLYMFWLHIYNVISKEFFKNATKNRTQNLHSGTHCPLQARIKCT